MARRSWLEAHSLLQIRLRSVHRPRRKVVAHDDSGAGVPPEDRIVIAGGSDRFRLLVALHGVAQPFVSVVARPRPALLQPGFGLSFADDPGVISPLVFVLDSRQQLLGLSVAVGVAPGEP